MSHKESKKQHWSKGRRSLIPRATIVYMCDGKVKAVAEYKANHSDWEPSPKDCYIEVMDEKEKELIEGFFRKRGQGEIN